MIDQLLETIIALGICVALPLSITWILVSMKMKDSDNNSNLIMKAIETGNCDPVKLAETLGKSKTPSRPRRNGRLLRGCIFTFLGVVIIIWTVVFFCVDGASQLFWQSLIVGMACLAVGVSYLIVYYIEGRESPRQ